MLHKLLSLFFIGLRPSLSILRRVKHFLIVYHSKTGNTQSLAEAAFLGATQLTDVEVTVRLLRAGAAGPADLRWANALLVATPENFGYMSGAMKDFFDRTFYEVEGQLSPLPYALMISAGNDGTGAQRAIERIVGGYPLQAVQAPLIAQGEITAQHLNQAEQLGMALAAGLDAGIY